MTTVILTLDENGLHSGFLPVTKIDHEGRRKGTLPLSEVVKLMQSVTGIELESREVKLFSHFSAGEYIGIGNNGPKWVAVKEIPPAEYFLTTVTGSAFKVTLPRLVARVTNHGDNYLFWAEDEVLTPETLVYPLVIGNISSSGWVCLGTTRLQCKSPEEIDRFVRQVIEAPSTGTYLTGETKVEAFYQSLTERWDKSIGAKHGIPLSKVLALRDDRY